MSVTVNVQMQGDLDNPRHREVAKEIADAIQTVLTNQPDLGYKPTVSISESKQSYNYRPAFSNDEFRPSGTSHAITVSTGFHINSAIVNPSVSAVDCPDKQD